MGEKEVISRRGLAKKHAALDYEVWQWKKNVEKTRGMRRVTKNEVQAFALEAYKSAGITNFKASDGWYRRWRVRWQNSNIAVNNDIGKESKVETDDVKEVDVKLMSQDLSKKRKVLEIGLLGSECKVKNTEECYVKAVKKLCKEKPQPESLQELHVSSPKLSVSTKVESHLHSEEEVGKVLSIIRVKNTVPIQSNPSTSGLDSLILNVNFVKLKQGNSKKRIKLNVSNTKESSKSNPHCDFATSTKILDWRNCNLESDTNSCDKIQVPAKQSNETDATQEMNPAKSSVYNVPDITALEEDEFFDQEGISSIEASEEENVGINSWTVISQELCDVTLPADSPVCSQADSGISITSSTENHEATSVILSPIFEQSDMDFSENEHELFCDSCEDFHPPQKCSHTGCKLKKEVSNSFLLNCVFEKKKEPVPAVDLTRKNTKSDRYPIDYTSDTLDSRLSNPTVVAPKGKRYLMQFRSKVINHALSHSVKLAAEKFKVNRNTVAEWLAERNRLSNSASPKNHGDKGVSGDTEFLAWLEDSKFNLTNELIKQKTQEWLLEGQTSSCKSQWLWMYAHRLNGTEELGVKKRYIVYPEAFKRSVVFHAQTHSNMAAARVFGVARKRIIEWQQNSGNLMKRSKNMIANNLTDEEVDGKVYEWFCQQYPAPTSREVRNKAIELYRAAGHCSIKCGSQWYYRWRARHKLLPSREQLYTNTTPLLVWALSQLDNNKCVSQQALAAQAALLGLKKISRGWTFRFCKKYSTLLQTLPAPETLLPSVLERQVNEYKEKLHASVCTLGVAEDRIIAVDEVPLHILPKDRAKKPFLVRRPGFESCQATLMVSCRADGTLLPTMFVFKGSGPGASSSVEDRVIPFVNETGQVSDEMMQKWLMSVCFPHLNGGGVVIMDSFDVHVNPEVSKSATSHNVHVAVTPQGCASRLLPVTFFCHSFKTMLEEMCQMWLSSQTAVLQSPSPDQLYLWAVRVHKHIAKHYKEQIQSNFKKMLLPQPSHSVSNQK